MTNSTSWHWYLDSDNNKMIDLYAIAVFFCFYMLLFLRIKLTPITSLFTIKMVVGYS